MPTTHDLLQQLQHRWVDQLGIFMENTADAGNESNPPDLAIEDYLVEVSTLRDALAEDLKELLLAGAQLGLSTRALSRASGMAAPTIEKRIAATDPQLAEQRRRIHGARVSHEQKEREKRRASQRAKVSEAAR